MILMIKLIKVIYFTIQHQYYTAHRVKLQFSEKLRLKMSLCRIKFIIIHFKNVKYLPMINIFKSQQNK